MELLSSGMEIAVFGMIAVFVLLGSLVFALAGMSRLAAALAPAEPPGEGVPGESEAELMVAVTAAVHAYRRRLRR